MMNKIRKFQNAGLIPYVLPYTLEAVSTRIDPSYLMRRRLTSEESEYETRKNDILGNILTAPFNKESAQYALEGLGEGIQAITPEFLREPLAKVGPYLSPLHYLAAISQGSINPKVGEKVVAGWDPRLLLLGRVGEVVYGPKAVRTVGRGVKGVGDLTRTVARLYMYRDLYPVGILSNEPLIAGGIEGKAINALEALLMIKAMKAAKASKNNKPRTVMDPAKRAEIVRKGVEAAKLKRAAMTQEELDALNIARALKVRDSWKLKHDNSWKHTNKSENFSRDELLELGLNQEDMSRHIITGRGGKTWTPDKNYK